MKKIVILLLAALTMGQSFAQKSDDKLYESIMDRTEWWRNDRFGMFIHFGLYSVPARGEWVKSVESMTDEDYQRYFDQFNPVDYNPAEWAKLAKAAGMKYAVMCAKHHDGFALWDTQVSDYKSTNTPFKRDLIREFLDAFRAEGLKVGVYFSTIDWYHPDYPKYSDEHHPMRGNEKYKNEKINWERYLDFMHSQVRELSTQYGKLDIMWFDFSYNEMKLEKWKSKELVEMVRRNQPGIILNNRLIGDGSSKLGYSLSELGDFETPEQGVPNAGLTDGKGRPIPWESCITMNNSWGYSRNDNFWKSSEVIIQSLVNCVSKGGNLLLNIGPDARGNIPQQSKAILGDIAEWMSVNRESIYGCGPATDMAQPEWGRFTQNGKKLYLHWMYPKIGHINLKGMGDKVKRITLLNDMSEIVPVTGWWGDDGDKANFYININEPTYQYFQLPSSTDTVFEIELK